MNTENSSPNQLPNIGSQGQKHSASTDLRGNLLILIATIFFAVNIPVVKMLNPEWLSSNDITVFRLGGGCILFWIASLFVKPDRIERSDFPRILIGGGIGLFLFIYLFNLSLRYANPIDVSIIMTLPPVFVILINVLFRHSRPNMLEIAGVLLGLAGAVIVIISKHPEQKASDAMLGNLLALASALCYAVYLIVLEKPTHKYRPISLLRWIFLASFIPCLLFAWSMPHAPMFHGGLHWGAIGMIAFVVLCPTFLSYLMVNPAIKLIGSELVSLYQYLLPVFATIASVLMGLARLHWMQVIAMLVIIAGMALTNIAKKKSDKVVDKDKQNT